MKDIILKRVYDAKINDETYRILVDRLWPRGMKKEDLDFNEWNKEIAPSQQLRKWFAHKGERFEEFSRLYLEELKTKTEEVKRLQNIAKEKPLTLLYAAKDPVINHAVILKSFLQKEK